MEASGPQSRVAPARSTRAVSWAVLAAAVLVVFGRTLRFPFLEWDDPTAVTRNPLLHPPSLENLVRIWTAPWSGLYVPASFTAWWVEMRVSLFLDAARAPDVRVFRAGLLLFHLLCAGVVLRILSRIVEDPRAALLGAVLFAVHPLQTESVAWITETRGVLAALLGFLALDVHLAGATSPGGPALARHHLPSAVLFALAVLAKPTAVAIPILAFLIDRFRLKLPLARVLPPVAVGLAIVAADVLLTRAQQAGASIRVESPLAGRPLVALDALGFYLGKLAWPFHLAADYGRRPDRLVDPWLVALAPVALAGVLAALPGRRASLLALALFAAALSPVLGLVRSTTRRSRRSRTATRTSRCSRRRSCSRRSPPRAPARLFARPARLLARPARRGRGARPRVRAVAFLDVPRWKDTETLFAANARDEPAEPRRVRPARRRRRTGGTPRGGRSPLPARARTRARLPVAGGNLGGSCASAATSRARSRSCARRSRGTRTIPTRPGPRDRARAAGDEGLRRGPEDRLRRGGGRPARDDPAAVGLPRGAPDARAAPLHDRARPGGAGRVRGRVRSRARIEDARHGLELCRQKLGGEPPRTRP
jgi:hypothetical protein